MTSVSLGEMLGTLPGGGQRQEPFFNPQAMSPRSSGKRQGRSGGSAAAHSRAPPAQRSR